MAFLEDLIKTIKVPTDITKDALEPASKQIGEGIGNLFYLAFAPVLKAKIRKEHEIKLFKEDIEREIAKIPADQLTEPRINIVGPALEAAKYYIEYAELREMFAKLIASSMNENELDKSHPSFVEVIKQFSPLDAQVIKYLNDNKGNVGSGMVIGEDRDGSVTVLRHFFPFPNLNKNNYDQYTASIDNLIRLGLLTIDEIHQFVEEGRYDPLMKHTLIDYFQNEAIEEIKEHAGNDIVVRLKKTSWVFTQFGTNFCECCLESKQ
ncbi:MULTISPECIES: DUF4393 domain-containing protein [Paenibacillus]|uniref:DUF4393 domain-containing protein n=1 Tax=Paenibacillus albilobatus TaxID=2716884 RepID=A0A919XDM1_9BACL|nr:MULTISPECIES: DUF4393 domain-containing protein [Paenibacillus]GIO30767.1 hypothetical protein J2TS6_19080 [Paenibacillus albilobatus]